MKSMRRQFFALMRFLRVTQTVRLVRRNIIAPIRRSRLDPDQRSLSVNIYHCTVQKAGSQWIKKLFSDDRVFNHSGLIPFSYYKHIGGYDLRPLTDRTIEMQFPQYTIVTPLYLDFASFQSIPKPEKYKAFFVMRDPRDLIVSWYFSSKFSHPLNSVIENTRQELNRLSETDGFLYAIDYLEEQGMFNALLSWKNAPKIDPNVMVLRFEDLIVADNLPIFKKMFAFCDLRLSDDLLRQLLEDYSFKNLKSKEKNKKDDRERHYRKGKAGDWQNYFNSTVSAKFREITRDLIEVLGYA